MHYKHRIKAVPSLVVMVAASLAGCQSAKAPEASITTAAPAAVSQVSDLDIVDAWSYLYGRYLVLQQENRDINVDKVGYNRIKYNPLGSAEFVNPNMDVAYLESWIAVDETHAVILNVPKVTGRYYTAQLVDGWGEVIANINQRTYPQHPYGKFALVLKGTHPPIPEGAVRVELPARKAKLLARVELRGKPAEAQRLQKQFTLDVSDGIVIEPPLPVPQFTPQAPIGVAIFDNLSSVLASYPDPMPKGPQYQATAHRVATYIQTGQTARDRVDAVVKSQAIPAFLARAKGFGTQKGGWSVAYVVGKFGDDVAARDVINYGGLWGNTANEAIYFIGLTDSDKQPLSGSKTYEIRFPKGGLPDSQVHGFWSVTLYTTPDYRVAPNALNRYSINNVSHIKPSADGTTSIWLAPTQPKGVPSSNWLPTPAGKDYSLNFRMYVAKPDVLGGQWFPPPIQQTH